MKYANVIELRLDDSDLSKEILIAENEYILEHIPIGDRYILIDQSYDELKTIWIEGDFNL